MKKYVWATFTVALVAVTTACGSTSHGSATAKQKPATNSGLAVFAEPDAPTSTTTVPVKPKVLPAVHKVQKAQPAKPAPTVRVVDGDTLTAISARYHRTLAQFAGWNHLGNPNLILTGQVFKVPPANYNAPPLVLVSADPAPAPQTHQVHATYVAPAQHTYQAPARQTYVAPSGGGFQACVATRESGNNPHVGYAGMYGLLPATWHSLGYSGNAGDADLATQTAAFNKLYAKDGVSPWRPYDGC